MARTLTNRIRSVAHISRYLCVGNVGEGVRDGGSTEGGWNLGEGVDIRVWMMSLQNEQW